MASQDVIELGSSEDEAEPCTKKMKPVPNAMVHIPRNIQGVNIQRVKMSNVKMPNMKIPSMKVSSVKMPIAKLPSVTIKPGKSNIASSITKRLSGKNVTITKIPKGIKGSPYNKPCDVNKPIKIKPSQKVLQPSSFSHQKKIAINPLNIMGKLSPQVAINKVPGTSKILQNPIKIQSPLTINSLQGVSVKPSIPNMKRISTFVSNRVPKKMKMNEASTSASSIGKVFNVELDNGEMSNTAPAGPKWYIRPEDDGAAKMEEENNKEPDMTQMVEITIEDSPVKPPCIIKPKEISNELSVIIEDSPVKSAIDNMTSNSNGDCITQLTGKVPHSKKKLKYPKEVQSDANKIEIEISPIVHDITLTAEDNIHKEFDTIIEIEESPLKVNESITSTPKKEQQKPQLKTTKSLVQLQENYELSEFNLVFTKFIEVCLQIEDSEDMKMIVEKKIKTNYRRAPKEYTDSQCFTDMITSKIFAMKAMPEKVYAYIKDVVDDLNWQWKLVKSQTLDDIQEKAAGTGNKAEKTEHDSKRQRQIRKLEKTIKKLHRAIQKLETQEVDFDDDDDSVYLLTERYKERLVKVHAKFCQLTNTKMPSEPHVRIEARPGQPAGPAKRLEKWINKKVPIGTPMPFPDFHDVLRCVRDANKEDHLGWNEGEIMEEARDLFTRCGKKLQRRRQENEWRLVASRISMEVDPAEKSDELKERLAENMTLAAKKETEVFNKYADRQSRLKLEAEEIGDKEAEESPVESDDDEPVVESPLLHKEERKKRLKRLLEEKSSKTIEDDDSSVKDKEQDAIGNTKNDNLNTDDKYTNTEWDLKINKETDSIANKKVLSKEDKQLNTIHTDVESLDIPKEDNLVENDDKPSSNDKNEQSIDQEEIHTLSDNSKDLESDVDELHLLQKLYSENEVLSSDSDSPIAISDTLSSSAEDKNRDSDVISIENSTYSESENKNDEIDKDDARILTSSNHKAVAANIDFEIECSSEGVHKKVRKMSIDEYNESIESILLASSDEEGENNEKLDETVVQSNIHNDNIADCRGKQEDAISKDSVKIVSEKCDDEIESKKDDTTVDCRGKQEDVLSADSVTIISEKSDGENESNIDDTTVDCRGKQEDVLLADSLTIVSEKSDGDHESNIDDTSVDCRGKQEDVLSADSFTIVYEKSDGENESNINDTTVDCRGKQEDVLSTDSVTIVSEKSNSEHEGNKADTTVDCRGMQEDTISADSVTIVSEKCDDENSNADGKPITNGSTNDLQDNNGLSSKLLEVHDSVNNVKNTVVTEIDDVNKQTVDDAVLNESNCSLSSKLDLESKSNKENIKLDSHD